MSTPSFPPDLIQLLRRIQRVAVLTGAGISAESGVPTFRDAQTGLWAQYDPHELATPEAFARNPKRVWEWYAWRRERVAGTRPNPGHLALVELERRIPVFTLITQNVDGLHQRAGSQQVLELHGNLFRTRCCQCGKPAETWEESDEVPPRCPACASWLRPDVIWFGEMLPAALWEAEAAATQCQIFVSIGTSTVVYPAAELPFTALRGGTTVVEINPQSTPLSNCAGFVLPGKAGEVLPALVEAVWGAGAAF
jgi:NAD-dependent deacetylase